MVEVDAVEDLVEFAKIKRLGRTIPQLTKTSILLVESNQQHLKRFNIGSL